MTSQLASQLQRLQIRPDGDKRLNESFLFSKSDARSFSREQIHQLAASGLQTLVTLDNRFHPFIADLFDPSKVRQERAMLHKEENHALDRKIEHLLTLLSPHLFLTAAQQVFEYLVRVHSVHVYNVAAVLRAFLPYHDHSVFSRAVLLLDLRDTGFDFLAKNQERGAPLLREHLVLACAESRKALRLVCTAAAMPFLLGVRNPAANALFASVATSLAKHPDAEALWRVLLPFVMQFLQGSSGGVDGSQDPQQALQPPSQSEVQWWREGGGLVRSQGMNREVVCTALIVLAAWSAESTFSLQTMTTVMGPILTLLRTPAAVDGHSFSSSYSTASAGVPLGDLLTLVDLLFSSHFGVVMEVGFAPLLNALIAAPWPQWSTTLSETLFQEASRAGVAPLPALLKALVNVALRRLQMAHSAASVPAEVLTFLRCAAEELPLANGLVANFLCALIQTEEVVFVGGGEEGGASPGGGDSFFSDVVAALQRRYQHVFDATLSKVLSDEATAEAAKGFLARNLCGTRYGLVEFSIGALTMRLPLFACLLHTVPEVRAAAALTLEAMGLDEACSLKDADSHGSCLLELLAHVAQHETSHLVAGEFLRVASGKLHLMRDRLICEDAEGSGAAALAHRRRALYTATAQRLLRSLYTMVTALSAADLQQQYFERFLLPIIDVHEEKTAKPTTAATKKKKKSSGGKDPQPSDGGSSHGQSALLAGALYYTALLYVGITSAASSGARHPRSANEEEEEETNATDPASSLVDTMSAVLLRRFPTMAKTASVLQPRLAEHADSGAEKARARNSSSDDDNVEGGAEEAGQNANGERPPRKADREPKYLAVLEDECLLRSIHDIAESHLSPALQLVSSLLQDSASSALQRHRALVEAAVDCTATMVSSREVRAEVLRFLAGSSSHRSKGQSVKGYLHLLRDTQRAQAREALHNSHRSDTSGSSKGVVGRGAKNSVLNAGYLPSNHVTMCLAAVVQGVVRLILSRKGDAASQTTGSELVPLLQLLGFLGAPLPTLVRNAEVLPAAFLSLLDSCSTHHDGGGEGKRGSGELAEDVDEDDDLHVDWYGLVQRAVYGPAGRWEREAGEAGLSSTGALAACLLLPLRAPASQRSKCLRQLQDAVLRGASGSSSSAKPTVVTSRLSSAHLVIAAALSSPRHGKPTVPIDVTAINSIIEAMAKEESRFAITQGAANLLSSMLAATHARDGPDGPPVVPNGLASDAVWHFFALPDSAPNSRGHRRALLDISALWPRLQHMLTAAAGPRSSSSSSSRKAASSTAAGAELAVSPAAADFLEAVCRRCVVGPTGGAAVAVREHPAVRLCCLLLRHPFLCVSGTSAVRPVYRHALTALAVALQQGLDSSTQSPHIFRRSSAAKGTDSHGVSEDHESRKAFADELASLVGPLAVRATVVIGSDVARLCVATAGGYQRLFRPFLRACVSNGRPSAEDVDALVSFLEVLGPRRALPTGGAAAATTGGEWQPPNECVTNNPLTFADALDALKLAKSVREAGSTKAARKGRAANADGEEARSVSWPRNASSLHSLRLLSALLQVAPAVRYDDDDDESLLVLVNAVLAESPLDQMLPLLLPPRRDKSKEEEGEEQEEEESVAAAAAVAPLEGSSSLFDVYSRHVLGFLRQLTTLCVEQPHALAERDPRGPYKLRGTVLKQALVLMASLLLQSDKQHRSSEEEADMSRGKVDTIAALLRALAPLLGPLPDTTTLPSVDARTPSFLLHIPIAALLIRLSSADFSEVLRYKSAADTCQEIISSFDVHTQISTITQLMHLVVDPHTQLSAGEEGGAAATGHSGKEKEKEREEEEHEEDANAREVLRLFRKMVKPNQVLNRQEELLSVIAATVKSDAFLAPFIQLQHHSKKRPPPSSSSPSGNGRPNDDDDDNGDGDGDEDPSDPAAAATQRASEGTAASDACMRLLLAALEMFSHYSDLNASTANDVAEPSAGAETVLGESKGYVMLLELLAGNALACVLAGINEPTFVECQLRLLSDPRLTLQIKGLEVLLDRLHHSLPTVENTLSDEELEQHRRDLRDPKKKLTLADLVRVKARPLTTKRSFQLMPNLMSLMRTSQEGALYATRKVSQTPSAPPMPLPALVQLFRSTQLSIAAVEELVRIVASGGSTQAEKTLLNTSRGKRVTEAQLSKLFGSKARVQMVHDFVTAACESGMPSLSQRLQTLLRGARRSTVDAPGEGGASDEVLYRFKATAEEGLAAAMCGLLTSLGTVSQVMGAAFTSAHCFALLNTTVSALVFHAADVPDVVSRGEAGSLLRHTSLSCLIRLFPSCWQLSQPYLPRILFAATHATNVDDPETSYLCAEVLAVLEALMEPQLFLEAATECLRGMRYVNTAVLPGGTAPDDSTAPLPSRTLRVQASTHSFVLFFGCIARRVQNLRKEELLMMSVMTEGGTAQDNFWVAALQSLAGTANAAPTAEVVQPVLDAFTVFFLKFKPKHCTRFLRTIAEWAFGGDANSFTKAMKGKLPNGGSGNGGSRKERNGDEAVGNRDSVPRTVMHGWLLFYALYNHLLEKLGSILDFSYATVLPYVVGTLNAHCSSGRDGEHSGAARQLSSLTALVLEGALESVRRMSLSQTPGPDYDYSVPLDVFFAVEEVFTALMPALVRQLTNVTLLSDELHDYAYRAEHAVLPAIRAFFACLNANKLQSKTQAELVRALRHPSRHVRRMALLCLDGVYADGGEELASRLMAEMLPSVVELTEDRDDGVVEEARKLCTNLSHMTGQDVLHAMS